jgi:hypothetical protein
LVDADWAFRNISGNLAILLAIAPHCASAMLNLRMSNHEKKTMITKEQLEAIIKAVDEGGDGDDEISEEEVIAILRDHAPGEIPFFQEMFAWERSRNRPH